MKKTGYSYSTILLHVVMGIILIGLGLDIYLRVSTGGSICPTEACAIVGDYVKISELNLVALGLTFFALFWGVYFFASRYDKKWLWSGALLLILGALAFDGAILGFQYFTIQQECHLCFGVGAALLLVLLLFAMVRKDVIVLMLGICVWLGGAAGGSILNIPDRAPQLEQLRGITWSGPEAGQWPRFYYFFSLHCPHCTTVLVNLAQNEPRDYNWTLLPLDTSPGDLRKIARAMETDMQEKNIFQEIVRLEQSRVPPDVEVPENLTGKIEQVRAYFRGNRFSGVPLMIVDERPGRRLILTGGSDILGYLYDQGVIKH